MTMLAVRARGVLVFTLCSLVLGSLFISISVAHAQNDASVTVDTSTSVDTTVSDTSDTPVAGPIIITDVPPPADDSAPTDTHSTEAPPPATDTSADTPAPSPTLSTDQADYAPGSVVQVIGHFFSHLGSYVLHLVGTNPDGSQSPDVTQDVTADQNGDISANLKLENVFRPLYNLFASDSSGSQVAATSFSDAANSSVSIEQCANGAAAGPFNICKQLSGSNGFVTGNVVSSKAHYTEGDFLPYRAIVVAPNSGSQQVAFSFDTAKGSEMKHAIDYLSSYNLTETNGAASPTHANQADPCSDKIPGCNLASPNATAPITVPTSLTSGYPSVCANGTFGGSPTLGVMSAWVSAGTITNFSVTQAAPATSGDCEAIFTINFDLSSPGATVVLAWSGHVAANSNPGSGGFWGAGNAVPTGSPYHMHAGQDQISGSCGKNCTFNVGRQDLQLASAAVAPPAPPPGATLTLVKTVTKDNGGTAAPTDWTLSATGPTNISGTTGGASVTGATVTAGTYTLAETGGPTGYTAGAWTCTGATSFTSTTVTVADSQTVTCTINNNDNAAHLKLVKTVTNDNGGTAVAANWTISAAGPTPLSGAGGAESDVNAGTYTLSESSGPAGYTASAFTCTGGVTVTAGQITLALGQNTTCTINNNDQPAQITIIKHVVNDNGGSANAGNWTMDVTATNPSSNHFAGNENGTTITVTPGAYSVAESGGPTGYSLVGTVGCSGTVAIGETKVCTLVNDDVAPKLHVIKHVINDNGGTAAAPDFSITVTGTSPSPSNFSGSEAPGALVTLSAGTYSVDEGAHAGYAKTLSTDCSGTIAVGDDKTCTITNDDIQPKLTVTKVVSNTHNGNAVVSDFPLFVNATGVTSGVQNGFNAGSYTVSETNLTGYTPGTWGGDCGANGSITLAPGDVKACTITNSDQPAHIVLTKNVINDNGGAATANEFGLTVGGASVTSGATTDVNSNTPIALNEAGHTGYAFVNITGDAKCPAVLGGTVTLNEGETISCTITNDDQAAHIIVIKHVDNGNTGGTATAANFQTTISGVTTATPTASGSEAGINNTLTTVGSYAVDEGAHAGYTKSLSADCTGTVALGETKTCTITNTAIAPTLTLIKTVINNNGGDKTAADFGAKIDGNTVAWTATTTEMVGAHTASEANLPGYTASAWGGDCAADGSVSLALGDHKFCTITNDDQQAYITVTKVVHNNHGGTAVADDFKLSLGGNAVTSGVQVPVNPGTYTAGETLLSGYQFDGYSGNCDTNGSVTIALGENKTCTLTNSDIAPKLTIIKHVINDNGGGASANSFTMNVTATNPSQSSFAGSEAGTQITLDAGSYSVDESSATGYTKAIGENCSSTIAIGEEKTCTITNDDQPAHLIVIKHVDNGTTGATTDASAFTIHITGTAGTANFAGAETPGVDTQVNAGTYAVTETGLTGYSESDSANCQGSIANGETKTCTITNTAVAPKLTLEKTVINDDGGTATTADFQGKIDTAAVAWFSPQTVTVGSHTASESTGILGYLAGIWGGDCDSSGLVSLLLGQNKTCTITNNDVAPTLKLVKQVTNDNGGTKSAHDFTLTATGTGGFSDLGDANAFHNVKANVAYALSESTISGYAASSWSCDNGVTVTEGQITLGLDQHVTCTITNNDVAPKLHLRKVVINDNGGTAEASAWTLTANGTDTNDISGKTPVDSDGTLKDDTFALSESGGPSGYTASEWNCVGGHKEGANITLGVGEEATCTITNNDQPGHLIVHKVTVPAGQSEGFTITPSGGTIVSPAASQTIHDGVSVDYTVNAGTFNVAEGAKPLWISDVSNCQGVSVGIGETKDCTITNTKKAIITIAKDARPNDLTDFTFNGSFGEFKLDDDFGVSGADNQFSDSTTTLRAPGTYTITETEPNAFWEFGGVTCTGNATPVTNLSNGVTIMANPGEQIRCVFVNNKLNPTRTLGFWQTHTTYTTSRLVAAPLNSNMPIGTSPHKGAITTASQLFGGFYANISKTTTNANRSALDKARMQLLQQLIAAKLNCATFTCSATIAGQISNADSVYATGTAAQILAAATQLDAYNNSGDTLVIGNAGSATPNTSKSLADYTFWDLP